MILSNFFIGWPLLFRDLTILIKNSSFTVGISFLKKKCSDRFPMGSSKICLVTFYNWIIVPNLFFLIFVECINVQSLEGMSKEGFAVLKFVFKLIVLLFLHFNGDVIMSNKIKSPFFIISSKKLLIEHQIILKENPIRGV